MPTTSKEIRDVIELRKEVEQTKRIIEDPRTSERGRSHFIEKLPALEERMDTVNRELSPVDRMRVYSRQLTPYILHEMDTDPFILPFLPFYIIGLVTTIPGNVAEGVAGVVNKIVGKGR